MFKIDIPIQLRYDISEIGAVKIYCNRWSDRKTDNTYKWIKIKSAAEKRDHTVVGTYIRVVP